MPLGEVHAWTPYLETNPRLPHAEGTCRITAIILIFTLILNHCEISSHFFPSEFSTVLFRTIVYFLCKRLVLISRLDGEEVGNCMSLLSITPTCDFVNFSF